MCTKDRINKYKVEHGGQEPSVKEILHMIRDQMQEYAEVVSKIPIEDADRPVAAAAFKLIYHALYNMLDDKEKCVCDGLIKYTEAISSMSTKPNKGSHKK